VNSRTYRSLRWSRRRLLARGSAALGGLLIGCGSDERRRDGGAPSFFDAGFDQDVPDVEAEYDLIVIGSGFAGVYLGQRLIDDGYRVLILEAGGDPGQESAMASSFQFTSSGDVDYPVNQTRIIAVGGTSNHWGGVISRPWPNDFRMRTEYRILNDWPISYEDVESYLCASEQLLQVRGSETVASAEPPRACAYPQTTASATPGIELEGALPAYVPVPRSREDDSTPVRLAREVIPRLLESDRVALRKEEQVTRIVTLDGSSIDHVQTVRADGSVGRYGARLFVAAAGAIETPRLLLLSRSRFFPDGLGNRHGLVGRYFGEHPSIDCVFMSDLLAAEPAGEYRTFEFVDMRRREGLNGYHVHLAIRADASATVRVQTEIESRAENRVRLSRNEVDPRGDPLPDVQFGYSERDQRSFDHIRELLQRTKTSLAAYDANDFERWRAHPSGTCRMATNEQEGVVDPDGKVFGVENLYVSGACTFTTAGTANPTNLVVALSLRLADHLREQLG
jgi:glucose dehydrogenase